MSGMESFYVKDFAAWAELQARLLQERRFDELDVEHLAEELWLMTGRERRELRSRMVLLVFHLLKWQHEPERRSRSWRQTIQGQRDEIKAVLDDSPSLRPSLPEVFANAYGRAREKAADETNLPLKSFPKEPPFTLEQALDPLFPDDLGGPEREMAND